MPSSVPFLRSCACVLPALIASALSCAPAQEVNVLTEAEQAAGWQLMFDGKSLAGWHSFKKTTISESGWIIKDSSVYLRGPAVGALLAPEKFAFKNFEIAIDWKIADGGNSGIFLRYLETEASENIRTGPESQVCGKLHSDYKSGATATSPGACYAMYPPAQPWIKPAEQYNTFHVVMYEKRVAHFGNGVRLLEYEIGSPDWTAKYEVSKYASFPLYGDIHAGKLFLQDHASPVWYRNIKIRPLARDPWADSAFVWPDQMTGISLRPEGYGVAAFPVLRAEAGNPGRISLELPAATIWELGLSDSRGRRLGAFRGRGGGSLALPILREGAYFLSGTVGDRAFSRRLPVP
jgi:hypothetical protein